MFSPNCPNPAGRPYLHWPPPPPDAGEERLVAKEDENYAVGAEAWRQLGKQIHPAPRPTIESRLTRIRRQWMEGVLACAGGLLGWFAPLLVKQAVPGAGATLYECAEEVLCPLFAFVGGGIGITCGNAWTALRQRGGKSRP